MQNKGCFLREELTVEEICSIGGRLGELCGMAVRCGEPKTGSPPSGTLCNTFSGQWLKIQSKKHRRVKNISSLMISIVVLMNLSSHFEN